MSIAKELFDLWHCGDLAFCIKLFRHFQEEAQESSIIGQQMKDLGFIVKAHSLSCQPATSIGTAMQFANKYGLQFDIGTTTHECRAILPRSKWQREINRNVPLATLAFFTVPESYEQIEDFQGISDRVEIAICRCLIMARTAGVI